MNRISRLSEISQYKDTVISRILECDEIVKALNYTDENYLSQPTLDDPSILIYKNIFPHRFIPEVQTEKSIFITVTLRKVRKSSKNKIIKVGHLFIEVFAHKSLYRTDYGVTRVDHILNLIDELFNSQRGIGIGELEFDEMDEFFVNNNYSGAYIDYRSINFN